MIEQTEKETHLERPHAEFGPSGLKPLAICAGFENREGTNAFAEMGNRIHNAVENEDTINLEDDKEIDIYNQCILDRDQAIAELEARAGMKAVVYTEQRLHMDLGATETFGTGDLTAIAGKYGLGLDYKTGLGEIDAPIENLQSTAYAIGIFQAFPDLEELHFVFSIPQRAEYLEGTYYRKDLKQYIGRIARIILNAERVRAKWALPGGPPLHDLEPNNNCTYCKHQEDGTCPALGFIAMDLVNRFEPGILPHDRAEMNYEDIDDLTLTGKMLTVAHLMKKWSGNFIKEATAAALTSEVVPGGWRLKSSGSPRKVSDVDALIEAAVQAGLTKEEVYKAATISLTPLREAVRAKAPKRQKTVKEDEFLEYAEGIGAIVKGENRNSLVPIKGEIEEDDE